MTNSARLFTVPWKTLSLPERTEALAHARDVGRTAAGGPVDPSDLEAPRPLEYYVHVVAPMAERDLVNPKTAGGWKLQCLDHRALEDPRVQAFFVGWHEQALELLAELSPTTPDAAAAEPGDDRTSDLLRLLDEVPPGDSSDMGELA